MAASLLFATLTTLAIGAFMIASDSPILATKLMLGVSVLNLCADIASFISNFGIYRQNQQKLAHVDSEVAVAKRNIQLQSLYKQHQQLVGKLSKNLFRLTQTHKSQSRQDYCRTYGETQAQLQQLIELDNHIQALEFPKNSIEKEIQAQTKNLTLSVVSITASILNIAAISICLASSGTLPIGVSAFLAFTFLLDFAELTKNIYAKNLNASREKEHKATLTAKQEGFVEEGINQLKKEKTLSSSYELMLRNIDFSQDLQGTPELKHAPTCTSSPSQPIFAKEEDADSVALPRATSSSLLPT